MKARLRLGVLLCALATSVWAAPAGRVLLSLGDVQRQAGGKSTVLQRGDVVDEGDIIVTGGDGLLQLRMVDNGRLTLNANSRMLIHEYRFNAASPANNGVRVTLEQGRVRSVTGDIEKQHFRLNTPIAAIGIRGTDFVAYAGAGVTQVQINSGAVQVSPFGDDCARDALGACQGGRAKLLTASMKNFLLQLRANEVTPQLVPLSELQEIVPAKTGQTVDDKKMNAVQESTATELVATAATAPLSDPSVPHQLVWGRWSRFIQPGSDAMSISQAYAGREATFANDVFALFRTPGFTALPAGQATFQLDHGEAVVLNGQNLSPAGITGGQLALDFNQRRFNTNLTVDAGQYGRQSLSANGTVNGQGLLLGTPGSQTAVYGALSPDSKEAGYLFTHPLGNGASLQGATLWVQPSAARR